MKKYTLLIFAILLLYAPTVMAGDILVVQSMTIKPYNEALQGCKSVCKAAMHKIVSTEYSEAELQTKVRRSGPGLILAIGQDALAKVRGMRDVPIVYLMVLNPHSLVRESGNITGVSMNISPDRQLSLLRQVLPRAAKIGVIYDPAKSGAFVARARDTADSTNMSLVTKGVRNSREALSAAEGMKGKIDLLWLLPDTTVVTPSTIDLLLLFSIENMLPLFTFSEKYAEKGALLSMEADPTDMGRQAGEMANRILAGTDVGKIEKEDARGGILTVNLIVAKKLGISINGNLLKQARVIK